MKNNTINTITEIAGWYGSLAVLSAFFLVSFELITPDGVWFQLLNLTGALGIISEAYHEGASSVVFLNVAWVLIAAVALVNIFLI